MRELVNGKIVDVSRGDLLWSGDKTVFTYIWGDYGENKRYHSAWYRLPSGTIVHQVQRFGEHKDGFFSPREWRLENTETAPVTDLIAGLEILVRDSGMDPRKAAALLGVSLKEW